MDPRSVFCPNSACPAREQLGRGNIQIHSQKERRYRCSLCRRSFSKRRGTPFYRCRTPPELMTLVLTLLASGCPPLAIVVAFGFQARTVRKWLAGLTNHCWGWRSYSGIGCRSRAELALLARWMW